MSANSEGSEGSEETERRVAIITGGSRGIGIAVVEALLDEGWAVHLCSRSSGSVETALGNLAAYSDRVSGAAVDVADQDQVDRFIDSVLEQTGRIDLLVNNAGIGHFGAVDEISGDDWRRVLRTNLDGCFYAMRAVAPTMRRQGDGWIVNVASLAGRNAFAGGGAYNASKFGLVGLSEAAMLDLRADGVRVTTILPGSVDTDFRPPGTVDDASWMLRPEDVARTIVDLLGYPERALPSRIELRPSRPPGK